MRVEDYPPQEPLSELGAAYHAEVMRRGAGLGGTDVPYGEDPYQRIALFVPNRPTGSVLAFLHGGGWTNGYKEWLGFMAPAFTQAGILFASIGYRLAPAHVFPTAYHDCCDAVAWLARNVAAHGGDPRRLFVGGHSSGGHYAALMAVRQDWQAPRSLPADVLRGCLPISGVYDFGEKSGLSMRPRFLGPPGNEIAASPIRSIQGVPRPFLMTHGDKDFPHLVRQAVEMEQALRRAGGEVERLVLAGRDHFSASYAGGEADGPWVPHALDWINKH
jgi:arylformamidase